MAQIEWILIRKFKPEPIGAIGFVDGKAALVIAFYDDRDGNKDGKVSFIEAAAAFLSPVSLEGSAVTEVAMAARTDMEVLLRDASFAQMAAKMYLGFARGLVADGIFAAYFKSGVSMAGKGVAKIVTNGMIKEFVVRKGFEKAVREAFDGVTGT